MYGKYWADYVAGSLMDAWQGVANFIPQLLGALVIFILGLIVASGLGMLVEKIFESLKIDDLLHRMGIHPHFERAGVRLRAAKFMGQLVYWFFVIVFLVAASDSLHLPQFSQFLQGVVAYLKDVILAVLILLASVVVANLVQQLVVASVASAKLAAGKFLGTFAWWAIVMVGVLSALDQLNIAPDVIRGITYGLIGMISLAGGLAFGLGGRDYAAHLLSKLRERTE